MTLARAITPLCGTFQYAIAMLSPKEGGKKKKKKDEFL